MYDSVRQSLPCVIEAYQLQDSPVWLTLPFSYQPFSKRRRHGLQLESLARLAGHLPPKRLQTFIPALWLDNAPHSPRNKY